MSRGLRESRRPNCAFVFMQRRADRRFSQGVAQCLRSGGLGRFEKIGEGRAVQKVYRGLLVHACPRSAVRNMIGAGIPEKVAMGLSGHKTRIEKNGGPPETRTPDPLIKSQLLYQLS